MADIRLDPDAPWMAHPDEYATTHPCPLPTPWDPRSPANPRWLTPGTTWTCPECGLLYTAARTGTNTAMWISTGTAKGSGGNERK